MIDTYTELGEGVFLDEVQNSLFWIDINQSVLFSYVDGQVKKYQVVENVSTVLFVEGDQVYLTNRSGIITYNLASGEINQISKTPAQYSPKEYRANDGVRLSSNVYMYGVMRDNPVKNDGAIILSRDGICKVVYEGISIPNTFIRMPNTNSLLITDSFDGIIYKFDFDGLWKTVKRRIEWSDLIYKNATPDGGCISSDGRIFLAIWDGFKVLELDLNGRLVREFKIPVPRPTNCTLNTEESQLFITSAYEGLSEYDRNKYPLSGSILTIDVNE